MTRRACAAADLVGRAESFCSVYLVGEAARRSLRGYRTQHTLRTEVGAPATCAAVPGNYPNMWCGDPSRQRKWPGEDRARRPCAAEVDRTDSADAIELALTDRISHACKELE